MLLINPSLFKLITPPMIFGPQILFPSPLCPLVLSLWKAGSKTPPATLVALCLSLSITSKPLAIQMASVNLMKLLLLVLLTVALSIPLAETLFVMKEKILPIAQTTAATQTTAEMAFANRRKMKAAAHKTAPIPHAEIRSAAKARAKQTAQKIAQQKNAGI